MSWWNAALGGNTVSTWAMATAVGLTTLAALFVAKRFGVRRLAKLAAMTSSAYDDIAVDVLRSTSVITIVAIAIAAGARSLHLDAVVDLWVWRGVVLVVAVQAARSVTRALRLVLDHRRQREGVRPGERTLGAAAAFIVNLVVWSVVTLVVLANFGVEVTALVSGFGIGGIAAALAVQNVLGDLFAALSLYVDRPFDIGDFVVVDTYKGTVEKISWRSTQLRSLDGELVILSNGDLARARVRNFKRMTERRVVVHFGVEYSTPTDTLQKIPTLVRDAVGEVEGLPARDGSAAV
jgi:small-conductance mechanosensitive channel